MILVTGAGGHIGNVLVRRLCQEGCDGIRVFVQPDEDIAYIESDVTEVVRGDICDAEAVFNAVRGCDSVFHLAGLIDVTASHRQLLYDINVGGTKNVVDACLKQGVRRLVHVSSIDALQGGGGAVIDETTRPDIRCCQNDYSATKLQGALEVFDACKRGLDAVVAYPTAVVGPYDHRSAMSGILFREYMNVRRTVVYFDGRFDFVDVRDVADGLYRAWQHGKTGEGYILSGEPCNVRDMVGLISESCGKSVKMLRVPVALVRAFAAVAPLYYALARRKPVLTRATVNVMVSKSRISGDKARRELGFSPRPLGETVQDTVRWYREAQQACEKD